MPNFSFLSRDGAPPLMPFASRSCGHHKPGPVMIVVMVIFGLFWMGAVSCFLLAVHRISRGLLLAGRAQALQAAGDSMTDEEKRTVAEYLRRDALRTF